MILTYDRERIPGREPTQRGLNLLGLLMVAQMLRQAKPRTEHLAGQFFLPRECPRPSQVKEGERLVLAGVDTVILLLQPGRDAAALRPSAHAATRRG